MTRIGIVGIENSHVDHFVRFLNAEHRYPGSTVVAVVRGEPDRTETVRAAAGDVAVVEAPADLIGLIDAAIVCSRDGARHRGAAVPLLAAGVPVLVDKPLATDDADAQAMIDAAAQGQVPLVSASAVRHTPEVAYLVGRIERDGAEVVAVTGPADPASEYSGLFFYGIHVVETALELVGDGPFGPVQIQRTDHSIVATTIINGINVVLTFVLKDDLGQVPFHATVVGRHGVTATPLTLGPDYNAPLLERFMDAITSGRSPMTPTALLRPVQLLAGIINAHAR